MNGWRPALGILVVLVMTTGWARAESDCTIIYGEDWAFVFEAPARWTSQCRAENSVGAALALWPEGTTFADASAVMYVTVNERKPRTLKAFAADEQRRFRASVPDVIVRAEAPMAVGGGATALVFRLTGDPGQNQELIAYVEGPTRFFIVVISARNAHSLEKYEGVFQSLLKSFVPMRAKTTQ